MKKFIAPFVAFFVSSFAYAERVGDITSVKDVRDNQLQGFGLVVGLPNTGDKGNFSTSSILTLIQKYGIKVPDDINLKSKNIAAVMINANLPAFSKKGQRIDVTVSSLGDAKSLKGGTLITTPLMGLDGRVYAISQGQILVDGISAVGLDGSSVDVNTSSVGRIPNGATVENELSYDSVFSGKQVTINLNESSFDMVTNIEKAINDVFGAGTAEAIDAGSLYVTVPKGNSERIRFLSMINGVDVELPEAKARVVINSRSGTVMFTKNVTLSPVAISEGNVVINISENMEVSQPNPLGEGRTVTNQTSQVSVERTQGEMQVIESAGTLQDLVEALNSIGTGPKDMASIIQLLKDSGALKAEVIVN